MDEIETLIFRTDRIGDFIISCPFIISYKKKYNHTPVTIISSQYNFNYIKSFDFIKKTIPLKAKVKLFPKLLILLKMIIMLRKNKYKHIIILDGKARSFFISFFLKGDKSILLQSKKLKLLSKIFKYKFVENYEIQSQLKNFSFFSNILGFKILDKNPAIHKNLVANNKLRLFKNYIVLHVDEKWFSKLYYSDFIDINPKSKDLKKLICKISNFISKDCKILITSGKKQIDHLNEFISNFETNDDYIYKKKINDHDIIFLNNISIEDLTFIVKNSKVVICCEGAISHLSFNFNIPTLAMYEKKKLQHTKFWTGHMKNISLYERKNIDDLLVDDNFFNKIKFLANI